MSPVRVVLDTNTVVSALVFTAGRLGWLRAAWQTGRVLPLASHGTVSELIRVLHYEKLRLDPIRREVLLGDYLPYCEVISPLNKPGRVPACRDPDDRVFLHLAAAGRAQFLVTGDADLLSIGESQPYRIVTPADFRAHMDSSLGERSPPRYAAQAIPRKVRHAQRTAR